MNSQQRQLLNTMGIEVWTLRSSAREVRGPIEPVSTVAELAEPDQPAQAVLAERATAIAPPRVERVVALCLPGTILMLELDDRPGTKRLAEDVLFAASGAHAPDSELPYKQLVFDAAQLREAGAVDTDRAFTSFAKKCLQEHAATCFLATAGLIALVPVEAQVRTIELPLFAQLASDAAAKRNLWRQLSRDQDH